MSARKTERLLNLVICLLATRRYLSAEQIRRTVAGYEDLGDEAFKRKFERDKEDLRELGIPLETGSDSTFEDEPGYRIRRDDYDLPALSFEPAELAALVVAARTWQHASLGAAASGALLKLKAAGIELDDTAPIAVETRVATSEPAFEPLRTCAADRRPVRFDYREHGTTRHVEPWGLVSWHGRWYLVGHDRDRGATRVFRLSRIAGDVTPDGDAGTVAVPEGLDLRSMVMDDVGARPAQAAVLLVRQGKAVGVRRRAQSVEPQGDGWDRLHLEVRDIDRLVEEIAALGGDVLVVEPREARDRVVARLRSLAGAAVETGVGEGTHR